MLVFSLHTAANELVLTLANTPPLKGVVSTVNADSLALRVASGHKVSFARTSGRDYQQRARGGFLWAEVESVPINAESVALTPTLKEDGSVTVALEVAHKKGSDTLRYSTTVVAQPGEWVKLFGPAESQDHNRKVYGTQNRPDDALYLRIE